MKESGFSQYLRKIVAEDPSLRGLILAEIRKATPASQGRVLRRYPFLRRPDST